MKIMQHGESASDFRALRQVFQNPLPDLEVKRILRRSVKPVGAFYEFRSERISTPEYRLIDIVEAFWQRRVLLPQVPIQEMTLDGIFNVPGNHLEARPERG